MSIFIRKINEDILLYYSRTRQWTNMQELLETGVEPVSKIKSRTYEEDPYLNLEMLPIHFAIQNNAPIAIIHLLIAMWPQSLNEKDGIGCKPIDYLQLDSPNEIHSYLRERMNHYSIS